MCMQYTVFNFKITAYTTTNHLIFWSLILPKTFPKGYYIKEGILQEITEEFLKRKTILNYSYPFTPFKHILRTFLLEFYFPI